MRISVKPYRRSSFRQRREMPHHHCAASPSNNYGPSSKLTMPKRSTYWIMKSPPSKGSNYLLKKTSISSTKYSSTTLSSKINRRTKSSNSELPTSRLCTFSDSIESSTTYSPLLSSLSSITPMRISTEGLRIPSIYLIIPLSSHNLLSSCSGVYNFYKAQLPI